MARVSLQAVIETERLVLRVAGPRDVRALGEALARNERHLDPWTPLGQNTPAARTPGVLARRISDARRTWREDRGYALVVVPRGAEGRIVGRVALNAIVRGAFHNAYLGYWMDTELCGRGLMTEAVRAAVGWAFAEVGLHRVQAAVMPRNAASLRVLEKLGFRREGLAERYLQIAGRWEDHVLFAVTREEWPR